MTRQIDYGAYQDDSGLEHQLTKELEQLNNWICSVTDMDRAEAFTAMHNTLKGLQA